MLLLIGSSSSRFLHTTYGGMTMKKLVVLFSLALFVLGGYVGTAHPGQTAPDNTGVNVRDRNDATLTPGDQSESEADRALTQQIRQAVVGDKSLSTMAKNIKIITIDGVVTLRGPVQNANEKKTIEAKVQHMAGVNKVDNQLEVKER
jgi:hyperosmotically inducible protein